MLFIAKAQFVMYSFRENTSGRLKQKLFSFYVAPYNVYARVLGSFRSTT